MTFLLDHPSLGRTQGKSAAEDKIAQLLGIQYASLTDRFVKAVLYRHNSRVKLPSVQQSLGTK